ncbi:MAG: hopanoid biosynthesis associated radical SAM protein HpnJ, partial [Hyphomicrobiales bacterium]|nr:hopanoid biosynthesis associated radical SAM protein HpnJ [Hyphomicrobiales bacterium]
MRTLFLQAPSFDGFDGGAGSRYQARREIRSFWYPTWLAQVAAVVPDSKLIDAVPHRLGLADMLREVSHYDLAVLHTSTPSFASDVRVVTALKAANPRLKVGFVGAKVAVDPQGSLDASPAIDFVAGNEFDFTIKEVAEGRDWSRIDGLSYRDSDGVVRHNPPRVMLEDMDELPFVTPVYKRDLQIEKYFIGYLRHPYVSFYTGRGCKSRCTFCLWPQTVGGHRYRTRSVGNVIEEIRWAKQAFPQVKEFFFDDDTFTANLPRAREIAKKLAPLGVHWSCNSRANLDYDTIKSFKDNGLRLFLVGYESGNDDILARIKKGVTMDEMRRFTKSCHRADVVIHGTFILGLPVETRQTIENTINFAKELDVFSLQVSLAAPYPGTELYEMAKQNGWFVKKDKTDLVENDGLQQSTLEYPGLDKDKI